mmetsp:Transcript_14266/g.40561  ORF Transcript_14266/g.40561 Transcript_14266/m.40561 type:complete len:138 (-) Transcript_14266:260-673(-)
MIGSMVRLESPVGLPPPCHGFEGFRASPARAAGAEPGEGVYIRRLTEQALLDHDIEMMQQEIGRLRLELSKFMEASLPQASGQRRRRRRHRRNRALSEDGWPQAPAAELVPFTSLEQRTRSPGVTRVPVPEGAQHCA